MSGKWASSDRASRLPKDWPAIVRRIKDRDGHRCTVVVDGRRCTGPADQVDHIRRGDDHRDENLAAICSPHHKVKTQAEALAARPRTRRPTEKHPGIV